jgi:hypothetical protein
MTGSASVSMTRMMRTTDRAAIGLTFKNEGGRGEPIRPARSGGRTRTLGNRSRGPGRAIGTRMHERSVRDDMSRSD